MGCYDIYVIPLFYLFKAPVLPTPECAYRSEGDLTKDGKIVCPKHGAYVDR